MSRTKALGPLPTPYVRGRKGPKNNWKMALTSSMIKDTSMREMGYDHLTSSDIIDGSFCSFDIEPNIRLVRCYTRSTCFIRTLI